MIDVYSLAGFVNSITSFSVGLFVYLKGRNPLHRYWFLMNICVAIWALLVAIEILIYDLKLHLYLDRIEAAFTLCIPVFFLQSTMHLLSTPPPQEQIFRLRLAYLGTIGLILITPTPLFIKEVVAQPVFGGRLYDVAGPLYFLFPSLYAVLVIYAIKLLIEGIIRTPEKTRKAQLAFFSGGTVLGFILGATCFPLVFNFQIVPVGFLFVWLYTIFITYAIFQHRLMDIQVVIRRSILYALVLALLVAGYFGLVCAIQQLFRMTLLQHHILALTLTAITTFCLGLLVFLAEPKRRLNQVFGLYSLAISWWAVSEAFLVSAPNQSAANFWSYIHWIGVIPIAPTFVHTVFLSTGKSGRKAKIILLLSYGASCLLLLFHLLLPNILLAPPKPVGYARFFQSITLLGSLVPLTFLILVNVGLWKLWQAYQKATGQRKTQLKYLFWSSMVGYLGGSPDWGFVFGLYIPLLSPFGIYGVPLYSIAATYAVLHHKLFDVNLVIRKSLVYSILVTLLTAGYFGLVYGIERLFQITFGYQSPWISLAAFALMALAFQPLKTRIQHLVDWLIFRMPQEELVRRMERLEQETRQTEKLKAVATLAAGLSHELKNPLQFIQTYAEFLPERYDDPEFRAKCSEGMKTEIARITDLLNQLMEFAKPKPPALRSVEPHKILDSTLDLMNNEFAKRDVDLEKRYEANGVQIQADPNQLRQVILNLVLNALEAIGQKGRVTVTTSQQDGWFTFEVADTGPGIDPKILPRLFEPFNTNKPTGTGLGLSLVHSIIREHRGEIFAWSRPGQGTRFTVKLPLE